MGTLQWWAAQLNEKIFQPIAQGNEKIREYEAINGN
jgi:hypothetical protein